MGPRASGPGGLAILAAQLHDTGVLALPEARPGDARALVSAQVATAGGPIWVHTTHLHYRLDDGLAREHQVLAVDAAIRSLGRDAADSPQILCGDFNATPGSDEIRFFARADHAGRGAPIFRMPGCAVIASPPAMDPPKALRGRARTSCPGRCARSISIAGSTTCS